MLFEWVEALGGFHPFLLKELLYGYWICKTSERPARLAAG